MSDLELIKKYVKEEDQDAAIKKLSEGYPVQYIIGNVEFYGTIINVNENVLIPRFETEYLVDKVVSYLKKLEINNPLVLEIGVGSGCISIALKKNINADILGIDISESAIKVAKENAKLNNTQIDFIECDIHNFKSNKKFDLIISNPPYVPYNSEVDEKIKFEPESAIYASDNGIYFYKVILEKIKNNLKENYLLAFEIGDKEGNLIKKEIQKQFSTANIKIEKDLNNFERYIFVSNKPL